jgi:hypothetical protein
MPRHDRNCPVESGGKPVIIGTTDFSSLIFVGKSYGIKYPSECFAQQVKGSLAPGSKTICR